MKMLNGLLIGAAITLATSAAPAHAKPEVTTAWLAISTADESAAEIRTLDQVPAIGVVRLNFRFGHADVNGDDDDRAFFQRVAENHRDGVAMLQAALRKNPVTRKALAERGIDINRIVGVHIGSRGALRLYYL
jgi:hypothetical protein